MTTHPDPTTTDAWRRGTADALAAMAAIKAEAPPIPTSYTGAACSILASPMLTAWPPAVREWLWGKATRWPKGMEHPHHAISRADLGLDGAA